MPTHRHRTTGSPLVPTLLTAVLMMAAGAGTAAHAIAPAVPPLPAAAAAADTAWWSAFLDPLLDALLAQAGGTPAAQLAQARSYIELRVAQARRQLAVQLQQAAEQQLAWLGQQQPETAQAVAERSRWVALLATRVDHWRAVQRYLADEHDRCEAQLAALARQDTAVLHARLQPGAGTVPRSALQVPARRPVADGDTGGLLQALQAAASQAARARALAQAGELDLQSSRLRHEAGMATPLDVMETWQQLVAGVDRLAALDGALALAWAQVLQQGGGRVAGLAATDD